jgi:holliday junction DNA helicase RuvA
MIYIMFTFFKGEILHILPHSIILSNDFFGIEIYTPYSLQVQQKIQLYIHTNFSSDNGMNFFGFYSLEELNFFQLLISVPGLGTKTTIKLLQNIGMSGVANCIYNKDQDLILKIPGIGKKIASRIINDLWDKIPTHLLQSQDSYNLLSTLLGIGYEKNTILNILPHIDKNIPFEEQIRCSMALLNK